jgi:hypothetical protein
MVGFRERHRKQQPIHTPALVPVPVSVPDKAENHFLILQQLQGCQAMQ